MGRLMTLNMRQEFRKKVDRLAWIRVADSERLRKCILIDISRSGAKLVLDEIDDLPETFSLWLSVHGHPR